MISLTSDKTPTISVPFKKSLVENFDVSDEDIKFWNFLSTMIIRTECI